ncbi:MAG: hypothetical protein GM43_0645 [actinobacterium acMicro-4]|nr:MAG: hypothetical protein GM43_0645 [actinobacterium acMicro-4]
MSIADVVIASGEVVNELPFPTWVYGVVFLVGFFALAMVTYSYRNVANRHRHKSGGADQSHAGHH